MTTIACKESIILYLYIGKAIEGAHLPLFRVLQFLGFLILVGKKVFDEVQWKDALAEHQPEKSTKITISVQEDAQLLSPEGLQYNHKEMCKGFCFFYSMNL